MPRFLIGDEQGQIKSFHYQDKLADGANRKLTPLSGRAEQEGKKSSVQRMVLSPDIGGSKALVAALSNGSVSLSTFDEDEGAEKLTTTKVWKDGRFKQGSSHIGLASHKNHIFACTTNGALQFTSISELTSDATPLHQRTTLPMHLHDWELSKDATTFAYGGDEVELSVWNTEAAFQPRTEGLNTAGPASKKRKRSNELLPGEIWRAKNVANDSLGLRQPVRITSIDFLSHSSPGHQIVTGTQLGDVRRYDTRAARRPVSDWKGVGKVGGVQVVKKGHSENELFVSDHGTELFSLDLRNGRIVYRYKGLSGAVTSIAPSPGVVASTSNDRFVRIHSSYPPPVKEGQNLECKGGVLEKVYAASIPTVVVWDDSCADTRPGDISQAEETSDEVWDELKQVGESDSEDTQGRQKRR